jgi:hypothetical protein
MRRFMALAPKPDVFRNGSIASVWPSADDFRSSLEADTVTAGRHVSKVPAPDSCTAAKVRPRSYFGLRGNRMNPSRFGILTLGSD